mgnify:CR=1 FL=1
MSKLFDKAIIYSMAGITRNTAQDVASALAEDLTPTEVMSFNPDLVSTALNALGMPLRGSMAPACDSSELVIGRRDSVAPQPKRPMSPLTVAPPSQLPTA